MFILQSYKYYIPNQKKSEKNFMELQKNERAGGTDVLHSRSPARKFDSSR